MHEGYSPSRRQEQFTREMGIGIGWFSPHASGKRHRHDPRMESVRVLTHSDWQPPSRLLSTREPAA